MLCLYIYFFFGQIGGACRWKVCYQWGLPGLVIEESIHIPLDLKSPKSTQKIYKVFLKSTQKISEAQKSTQKSKFTQKNTKKEVMNSKKNSKKSNQMDILLKKVPKKVN